MNNYDDLRKKYLKDPAQAIDYLNVTLAQGDMELFMYALGNVVDAQGGKMKISKKANLNRAHLYKMLSKDGNPEIKSLEAILSAFGLRLYIGKKEKGNLKKAA